MSATLRLFVALELPAAVREALWAWSAGLDAAAWRRVPAERLHVTLAFLGGRPARDVAVVAEVLRGCARAAPELRCAAVVALPKRRPRVIAASLREEGDALARLQGTLAARLAAAGVYEPAPRPFFAHVTVGRSRRPGGGGAEALGEPDCAFTVRAVTLFASGPGEGGPRYEPLASVALGAAAG